MRIEEGVYESIINTALQKKLVQLPINQFLVFQDTLDRAEAAKLLSAYLVRIVLSALQEIKGEDSVQKQIAFCNDIIQFIDKELKLELEEDLIVQEGKILTAVLSKIGKTDKQLQESLEKVFPQSGLSVSNLFTGSNSDISIDGEIERDILSSNRIYWIVSFIRWSGLRIFEKVLKEFTAQEGAKLKIITTTYMGASEGRALEFLAGLPNTEIKISYQTQIERLHAKSYIFERNSGFDSAYIGSSNLSKSALTKGLEWNIRVTSYENPHIIEKAKATFEHYWNSIEFEDFKIGGLEKFKEALKTEKDRGKIFSLNNYFRITPLPFQKEILDTLLTERQLHHRNRNLIVAATGTGKTVIAAFDFKRTFNAKQGNSRLLFIAHRKEILEQAIVTFRSVLGERDFGQLWVGNYKPEEGSLDHLFVSVQTFNSQKEFFKERFPKEFYDFIIIDEAHHAQANSYRDLFELFNPEILLGLTATPERMDGRSLLPDFCNRVAAEIHLPDALSLKLLSPFQYFCVADESTDLRTVKWAAGKYDTTELAKALSNKQRIRTVVEAIHHYLTDPFSCKAVCFCTSKEHAALMSKELNLAGLKATYLVSGGGKEVEERRTTIRQQLQQGHLNFVCVVDIFNEGVDIPEIDTVLFLRPTESLTVFLQQLGRGLRISENKECLTVLDFVNQAHANYNFAEKFRALLGKSDNNIQKEIENGFPRLPAGCNIKMERVAKEYILSNIKNAVYNARRLRREIATFHQNTHLELSLKNFLALHHLDIRTIYSNRNYWSELKKDAGVEELVVKKLHQQIASGLRRLVQIDSPVYLNFIRKLIADDFQYANTDVESDKMMLMFYYDVWQKGIREFGFQNIKEGIAEINSHLELKKEISEIIEVLYDNLKHSTKKVAFDFPNVLEIHAQYSRDQILAAFDKSSPERPFPSQEGVVPIPDLNAELLLVTLNKSDKEFSPSTQYEDYAVNETIFHWQSQNRVGPESPVGISYIKQEEQKKTLLLFVRENKKDEFGFTCPYHFLGPVKYRSHKGTKPMSISWELQVPMPAYLWKAAAKMAVG